MSYLVLARKHRPGIFDEVIGQEHITNLLKKAIAANKVSHAYLFCGPRGIGKTSCARILAKALNCEKGPTLTPCGECPACKEIAQGSGFDVIEVDGASNRGIDEIRTLRENVKFAPSYGKYKIYIVDEVHMLTTEAFNALLKTLEEPPSHAKFIFATTEPHKLPATIISRCQRYDFKRISLKVLVDSLNAICKKEKYTITSDALYAIAKASQGSFRDALSILDQIGALSERQIEDSDVYSMLGLVESELLFKMAEAILAKDCSQVLALLDEMMDRGKDIKQLAKDFVEHFRNLMILKIGGKTLEKLVDYPAAIKEQYFQQAQKFSLTEILMAIDEFIKAQDVSRVTETLRIPLEMAFARLTMAGDVRSPQPGGAVVNAQPAQRPTAAIARPSLTTPISAPINPQFNVPEPPGSAKAVVKPILGDQRGTAILPTQILEDEAEVDQTVVEKASQFISAEPVSLEKITSSWDALTFAVSREKMSLATFLQEGKPTALKGEKLTIGFTQEHTFHKETLERNDNQMLVEKIFSEKLNSKIVLEYKILSGDQKATVAQTHEPVIQNALDKFKGKIVSKWHNE